MDAFTTGFLASVVANGLTTIVSYFGRQSAQFIQEKRNITETIACDATLSTVLQKATTDLARSLRGTPAGSPDRLRSFAASADVDAIIRQLYATRLTSQTDSLATLRQEFRACFTLHLQGSATADNTSIDVLFDALVSGCDRALEVAIDKGLLSAHEAKSAARTNLVLDELASMKRMIEFISRSGDLDVAQIEEFHSRLRSQIQAKHGYIVPPHFDARRRVPINDLYVAPAFSLHRRKAAARQEPQEVELKHILLTLYRAVILGNPGSGKSTLASKICHDLAATDKHPRLGGRRVTPVLVTLRDYGRERRERGLSIIQFIEQTCNSTYQLAPPDRAVEYLLRSGRLLVVFDGLDELIDTSFRQKVSEDVESFGRLYPGTPILITSREVGYEQAPLDESLFDTLRIAPFGEHQVRDYVTQWFAADTELTELQRDEKVQAFLRESSAVPDLRTNPLMLALMCNIYRGENYIPRNRPDVYEKCAVMLFEKWDKSRGINVPLPFEAHVRPAMMYLAHWVFSDAHLQGGVSERSLITKCTEYLCPRRYEDSDQAALAATEFIDFCRGRAWVFTDTGTTKEGERLYQFTHRTFLEYFTAAHLVRTHATPALLSVTLLPRIAAREWDVVAQLAFQLQNKHVEGAGDSLLASLLQVAAASQSPGERSRLLSFGARTLEFLVPSPSVTREIVSACVNESIEAVIQIKPEKVGKKRRTRENNDLSSELIGPLLAAAEENRGPVARQVASLLEDGIEDGNTRRAQVVLQIGMSLSSFLYRPRARHHEEIDPQLHDFWEEMAVKILRAHMPRVEALCRDDFVTCLTAVFMDLVTPRQMTAWHGAESVFRGGDLPVCGYMGKPPLIPYVTWRICEMLNEKEHRSKKIVNQWIPRLDEVAAILVENKPPWLGAKSQTEFERWTEMPFRHSRGDLQFAPAAMPPHLAFLAIVSCAIVAETFDFSDKEKESAPQERSAFHWLLRTLHASRAAKRLSSELATILESIALTNEEEQLLLAWAAGSVAFNETRRSSTKP